MTKDSQATAVKCILTLLGFIVTISDTFFWKLWVYRNMEYALFMPVYTSLWGCNKKQPTSLFIKL